MFRLISAFLGLSVLLCSAPAAPVPTHLMPKPDPLYFPTRVGAEWDYVTDGGKEVRRVVTAVKDGDGGKVVTVDGGTVGATTWRVRPTGLSIASMGWPTGERACDPVLPMLRLPLAPQSTWEVAAGTKDHPHAAGRFAARGPEDVNVPAGTFRAVRVEVKWAPDDEVTVTFWFAPGVGVVKAAGSLNQELKSFTPGKD